MGWLDRLARAAKPGLAMRDVEPLEGTRISLWDQIIPAWWQQNGMTPWLLPAGSDLADRVWVANRCQQMNSQQIASMPLEFHGPPSVDTPAWVSSPDPNWYPNGIGDAIQSIVGQMYGWGFVCLYVTDRYVTGFPRTWTVLPSGHVNITLVDGARNYKLNEEDLDPSRVVQIDRNPGWGLHGTSALRSYAQQCWGLLAAGNQALNFNQGGIPQAVLKSARKLTEEQAQAIQSQWMDSTQRRNGAPPVLPPELSFEVLSFNPSDLALLESQEFNAKSIMTAYGVPAVLMNMAVRWGLAYQNPATLGEMWWRFELRPTATRIANAFSAQMLPRGQWVSFDAEDTFAAIDGSSTVDDTQSGEDAEGVNQPATSQTAAASPAQLTAIGGGP